jgi:hypothetical protein
MMSVLRSLPNSWFGDKVAALQAGRVNHRLRHDRPKLPGSGATFAQPEIFYGEFVAPAAG